MINLEQLGWQAATVGELDHRTLKAPHVKLRSAIPGAGGDTVYAVDLRINLPNSTFLTSTEMHSFEHFLLWGFQFAVVEFADGGGLPAELFEVNHGAPESVPQNLFCEGCKINLAVQISGELP